MEREPLGLGAPSEETETGPMSFRVPSPSPHDRPEAPKPSDHPLLPPSFALPSSAIRFWGVRRGGLGRDICPLGLDKLRGSAYILG